MREQSPTRRQLEASLRSFLPERSQMGTSMTESKPTMAAVGLGGVMTGYVWGRLRGRRVLRRLFRIATAASIGRALGQKSPKWLSIALTLVLFRFLDRRATKASRSAKRAKT
jgi:hypothetical protein